MLHFQATQKLLNSSRIKPVMYLSEPAPGQRMHSWYVASCGSGFAGKMLLLYFHEPSLLTVVVKGKTIGSTIDQFRQQLQQLLHRHQFPPDFIEKEMQLTSDYIIGKTSNKSMLAQMNQFVQQVTGFNERYSSYDDIDPVVHEDILINWLYTSKGQKGYQKPILYWKKELEGYTSG